MNDLVSDLFESPIGLYHSLHKGLKKHNNLTVVHKSVKFREQNNMEVGSLRALGTHGSTKTNEFSKKFQKLTLQILGLYTGL